MEDFDRSITAEMAETHRTYLRELIKRMESHPRIEVLKGYQVVEHEGAVGNFKTKVAQQMAPRRES